MFLLNATTLYLAVVKRETREYCEEYVSPDETLADEPDDKGKSLL